MHNFKCIGWLFFKGIYKHVYSYSQLHHQTKEYYPKSSPIPFPITDNYPPTLALGCHSTYFFLGFHIMESWRLHAIVSDFFLQVDSDYLDTQFGISYQWSVPIYSLMVFYCATAPYSLFVVYSFWPWWVAILITFVIGLFIARAYFQSS